jgi:ferredoxin-type protein NapH
MMKFLRLGAVAEGKAWVLKIGRIRIATAALVTLVILSGAVGQFRYAGLDTLGIGQYLATCPLGYLERSLAVGEFLPYWLVSLGLVLLSLVLLGRVFCAWICPAGLLHKLVRGKETLALNYHEEPKPTNWWAAYSSYAVLAGVVIASIALKFPIFCLFCPIGLLFGALYAGIRIFAHDPPGLELVLFPAILVLELVVLRSWCRTICPLGALFSIIGSLNRTLVPAVKQDKCFITKGINCKACQRVCPEGIDVTHIGKRLAPNSCTKCLECYQRCPQGAIGIALFK